MFSVRKTLTTFSASSLDNFRAILTETGYQAGQHELFAENLSNNILKEIQNKSKEVHATVKENTKHNNNNNLFQSIRN